MVEWTVRSLNVSFIGRVSYNPDYSRGIWSPDDVNTSRWSPWSRRASLDLIGECRHPVLRESHCGCDTDR